MSKNLNRTRLQSEKKTKVDTRDKRRPQEIAQGTSSAPRLASSLAAPFPGRNECLVTVIIKSYKHGCLIIKEERRDSPCQICQRHRGIRKDGEEDRMRVRYEKRNGRLVGAADTSKELAEWRRLQRKNLNKLSQLKRKEWPQNHREIAVEKYAGAAFAKRKRIKAASPEYRIVRCERVKVSERGGSERKHGEERVTPRHGEQRQVLKKVR